MYHKLLIHSWGSYERTNCRERTVQGRVRYANTDNSEVLH